MTTTNSFWREVLDYLPNLAMIFRIDNNENTQLIFVNKKVQEVLGFTPQEYVLASESETLVKRELEVLVEDVARLSHQRGEKEDQQIVLHTRRGEERTMAYDFELFKVKSSTASFLSIDFKDIASITTSENPPDEPPLFVAESPAMKSLMKQVDALISSNAHILIRGEKSTGKKTVARMLARPAGLSGARLLEIDAKTEAVSSVKQTIKETTDEPLVFVIANIDNLSVVEQQLLKQLLDDKQSGMVRIIATSSQALENLIEQDQFDSDLYYSLLFHPLLLPPLRNRSEDIGEIVKIWIDKFTRVMSLPKMNIQQGELDKLTSGKWSGNFDELYSVLRKSVLSSEHGRFRLPTREEPPSKPAQNGTVVDVLPYDEMNRRYLTQVLEKTKGKIYGEDGAASLLDLKPTTLQSKLKKLGIR